MTHEFPTNKASTIRVALMFGAFPTVLYFFKSHSLTGDECFQEVPRNCQVNIDGSGGSLPKFEDIVRVTTKLSRVSRQIISKL